MGRVAMQSDSVMIDPHARGRFSIGSEFPIAYRLARRGGQLVLQGLWRDTEWEWGRPMQRDEWRDIPTVEIGESGDAGG